MPLLSESTEFEQDEEKIYCNEFDNAEKIPFQSFYNLKGKYFITRYKFNVPKKEIIGERKHKIMQMIWSYLMVGGKCERITIYEYVKASKVHILPYEMQEFSSYITRSFVEIEKLTGVEIDGGIAIKSVLKEDHSDT